MVGQFETIGDSRQVRIRSIAPIFLLSLCICWFFREFIPPSPSPRSRWRERWGREGEDGSVVVVAHSQYNTYPSTHISWLSSYFFSAKNETKESFFSVVSGDPSREWESENFISLSLPSLTSSLSLCLFLLLLLLCVRERECICILTIIVVVTNLLIGRIWLRSSSRNTFSSPTPQLLSPKQNKKNVFVEKWLKKISQNFIPFRSSSRNWKKFVFSPQKSFQNFEESKEVSPRCKSEL